MKKNSQGNATITVIKPDGSVEHVSNDFTFKDCQLAVGGLCEVVRLSDGDIFLVNEEGLIMGLQDNGMASMVANQRLVGTVVLIPKTFIKKVLG
jgi:hypothetical protein